MMQRKIKFLEMAELVGNKGREIVDRIFMFFFNYHPVKRSCFDDFLVVSLVGYFLGK